MKILKLCLIDFSSQAETLQQLTLSREDIKFISFHDWYEDYDGNGSFDHNPSGYLVPMGKMVI